MATNDELEKGKKLLQDQAEEAGFVDNALKSIAATLSNMFEEVIDNLNGVDAVGAKVAKSYERDIVGSIKKISSGLEQNLNFQNKINKGQNISKEIESKIETLKARSLLTLEKINRAEGLSKDDKLKMKAALKEQYILEKDNLESLLEQNKERQKSKSLTEVLGENLKGVADKLDKPGTLSEILKGNIEDVLTSTRILELAFTAISTLTLAANKSVTSLQKQLGISSLKATALRLQLSTTAFTANNLRVSTETLITAQTELNKHFQTAALFSADIAEGAAAALDANLMSGEAVSQLAGDAARLGQTFNESLKTQENAVNAVNRQTGAQIDLKTVLEASNKVSGQIRAQLGANPEAIARAVTQAKALGFELEQIASSGEALLNFESSIENELQAELLTGKQLNLERARLAALTGDLETLTSEISANVGDFNDFTSMNVLQQQAIAAAVGMTADQLADSLVTEENRQQLLEDAIASGNDQSVQQLKALDTQEKFEKVLLNIKGLFVDVATILSPVVDFIGLIAEGMNTTVGKTIALIGAFRGLVLVARAMKALQIGASIAAIFQGNAKFGPLGIAASLAGVLAMV